jgi:hypothetical protein
MHSAFGVDHGDQVSKKAPGGKLAGLLKPYSGGKVPPTGKTTGALSRRLQERNPVSRRIAPYSAGSVPVRRG